MSDTTSSSAKKPFLSNNMYDAFKWLALVGLPAVGTLYFALADIWHLPMAAQVVGTITAVDAFLGLVLNVANKQFKNSDAAYDGTMEVYKQDTRYIHQLDISTPPHELRHKDSITLKVDQINKDLPEDLA